MAYDPDPRARKRSSTPGSTTDADLSENQKPEPPSSSGYVSKRPGSTGPVPVSYPAPPAPAPKKRPPEPPPGSPVERKIASYSAPEVNEFDFFSGDRSYSLDGLHEIGPVPHREETTTTSRFRSRFKRSKKDKEQYQEPIPEQPQQQPPLTKPAWASVTKSPTSPTGVVPQVSSQMPAPTLAPTTPVRQQQQPQPLGPRPAADPTTQLAVQQVSDPTTALRVNSGMLSNSSYILEEEDRVKLVEEKSSFRSIIEWVIVVAGAIALALVIRAFIVEAFWIPSESMRDTLQEGDRILVDKVSYKFSDVQRGDVVVFRNPDSADEVNPELVKRVIGLPGETIEVKENKVFIDGRPLDESNYLADWVIMKEENNLPATTVPAESYYMLGDNRDDSRDSRKIGPVSKDLIIGKAFVRFWPLNRLGGL